jgi:hypothetical protein
MQETDLAKRLWSVFEEGQRLIPESARKQTGFNARPYSLALNLVDIKTNAMAPFIHPDVVKDLSHHQQVSLRLCESGGQKAVKELHALLMNTPAGATWFPNLSFFLSASCKAVHIELHSDGKNHTVGRYHLKDGDGFDDFCKALRQISLAVKIARPGPTRCWASRGTGMNTPVIQAADATSASLLVCALVLEFEFPNVLKGASSPPAVVEVVDMDHVADDLQNLVSQVTLAEKELLS